MKCTRNSIEVDKQVTLEKHSINALFGEIVNRKYTIFGN